MTRYVKLETIERVLVKLGIDPNERFDAADQDAQYTSCQPNEMPQYFELYRTPGLPDDEKRVLCSFMLESLNEFAFSQEHPLQEVVVNALFDNQALHKAELEYWMNTEDPDETNWWPVTKGLLRIQTSRAADLGMGIG